MNAMIAPTVLRCDVCGCVVSLLRNGHWGLYFGQDSSDGHIHAVGGLVARQIGVASHRLRDILDYQDQCAP